MHTKHEDYTFISVSGLPIGGMHLSRRLAAIPAVGRGERPDDAAGNREAVEGNDECARSMNLWDVGGSCGGGFLRCPPLAGIPASFGAIH